MRPGRASWSAEGVASIRALESFLHPPGRRIFDDPIAELMLRGYFRHMLRSRMVARVIRGYQQQMYCGVANEVLARACYAQEVLARVAAAGVRQVVILAAGFDGTAFRPGLPEDLVVYEVDRLETQSLKRSRLAEAGVKEPSRLVFVPGDLDRDPLAGLLEAAGFDRRRPALVTALGLLMYLPETSVETLFAQIGACLGPGGEVIYNHFSRYMLDPARSPAGIRRGARRLARNGEPFLSAADAAEMAALMEKCGLRQVESMDGDALTRRYFASRGDRRTIERGVNLARAVIARPPS